MRNLNRVFMAISASIFLSLSGVMSAQAAPLVAAANSDTADSVVTIDHGHIDIFHGTSTGTGNLVLQMADDTSGPRLLRTPESAILQVNADRWYHPEEIGTFAQIIGNKPAAILPLAQHNNSLWPGWDVMDLKGKYKAIDIVFDEVIGPKGGQIYLVGGPRGLSDDYQDYMYRSENAEATKFKVLPGKFIHDEHLSHTHVYWAFTKPGIYQFRAHLREADPDKIKGGSCVKTRVATYSWRVLDANGSLPKDFEMVNYGTPIEDKTCTVDSTTSSANISTNESTSGSTATPTNESTNGSTATSAGDSATGTKSNVIGTEKAPDKAKLMGEGYFDLSQRLARLQKELETINKETPGCWAGINCRTSDTSSSSGGNTGSANSTTNISGSASVVSGNIGAGSYRIPVNTHVHPNWVFTTPGTYRVVIRQTAKLKTGKIVRADAPLTFYVGGSGNANSGHFDLGADVRDGRFLALVRDDSHSPARYVSPSSLVFGLGSASREKAPAGIEFIAAKGNTIYRIPEVQKTGVPWLGANTMNPGVLANVNGGVTWSISSFSGPRGGDMAMFSGGGFDGKYTVWLNTRGIKNTTTAGNRSTTMKAAGTSAAAVATTDDEELGTVEAAENLGNPTLLDTPDNFLATVVDGSRISTLAAIAIFVGGMIILVSALVVLKVRK